MTVCPTATNAGRPLLCRSETLAALARVLDHSSDGHIPHHMRVAALAARLAARVDGADPRLVLYAALVHDVGIVACGGRTPAALGLEDQANHPALRCHPLVGAQMVGNCAGLDGAGALVLDHHEWANGHGYPRGKARDEIPPGAQVLRFADTCDSVLREQAWPDLMAFVHAVRLRTAPQVERAIADAGVELLGEPGLYPQLREAADIDVLVEGTIRRLGDEDLVESEPEVTGLLELFAALTDGHASDKIGHSRRVASQAVLVGIAMNLEPASIRRLRWAALVHDVGLVSAPKSLLDKPGMLSPHELEQVRRHGCDVERFLGPVHGLEDVVEVATAHGEAFDGSGRPHGLAGDAIPIESRVLAVCDTFDALTSRRPYREAREVTLAVDILHRQSGVSFDPDVVGAAVPLLLIDADRELAAAGA